MEIHYAGHRHEPTPTRIEFWLRELRSPKVLIEVALMPEAWWYNDLFSRMPYPTMRRRLPRPCTKKNVLCASGTANIGRR